MVIQESSITLNFPDNNCFRFEECKGYKDLQYVKEMDVCWHEQATDTLYIIELKNWENNNLNEESDPNFNAERIEEMKSGIKHHRIEELFKKSLGSICMFMSILLEKPYSYNIQACSPFLITKDTKIKLLTIINWTSNDVTYISTINTEYKSRFKSYAKLFDIPTFLVMTKNQAAQRFSWIT
jgi:hypothetical protein